MLRVFVLAGSLCLASLTAAHAEVDVESSERLHRIYQETEMQKYMANAEADRKFQQNMAIMHDMDNYHVTEEINRLGTTILLQNSIPQSRY